MIRNAVYLVAGFLLATAGAAFAAGSVTIRGAGNAQVEGCPEGYVCVTEEEYELHWDVCPINPTYTPTVEETPPSPPPSETFTPTLAPSLTPAPTDENGEREACNRGIGNLEENCDPGNSSGQGQGEARPAGEDRGESDGAPPPGRGSGKPDK